jgi:cyclopropane fatty-acyl-phospholipid synthase-like methyltransferase
MLPFSEACERNKAPILGVLEQAFADLSSVVEIGSGTGQHAVHFARHLPHLAWQPTERAGPLPALAARVALDGPPNLRSPIELDVNWSSWPFVAPDAVFTANTFHIMSWDEVRSFFAGVGRTLSRDGLLAIYGPFRYAGRYTSDSNEAFDRVIRERYPKGGIRDFEALEELATAEQLEFVADNPMPANNQLLLWRR